jgi:hypothetical protein
VDLDWIAAVEEDLQGDGEATKSRVRLAQVKHADLAGRAKQKGLLERLDEMRQTSLAGERDDRHGVRWALGTHWGWTDGHPSHGVHHTET